MKQRVYVGGRKLTATKLQLSKKKERRKKRRSDVKVVKVQLAPTDPALLSSITRFPASLKGV